MRLSQLTDAELEPVSAAREFRVQDMDMLNALRIMEADLDKIQVSRQDIWNYYCSKPCLRNQDILISCNRQFPLQAQAVISHINRKKNT